MISGFCFVAPALPSTSSNSRTKEQSNSNRKDNGKKDSFIWRASFGQQLQRLYMRALLQNENAGVNYIRKSLQKRRDEVALGKLQVYADAGQQVQQVNCCLCSVTCNKVYLHYLHLHLYILMFTHVITTNSMAQFFVLVLQPTVRCDYW